MNTMTAIFFHRKLHRRRFQAIFVFVFASNTAVAIITVCKHLHSHLQRRQISGPNSTKTFPIGIELYFWELDFTMSYRIDLVSGL